MPRRDDGHHLWEPPDEAAQALDFQVQAARGRSDAAGGTGGGEGAGRAREATADERGTVIATYPEWDAAAGVERPDWTVLREVPARPADPAPLRAAVEAQAALRRQIAGLVRAAAIGRPVRLKRQPDGDDLNMDAALDATVALRAGLAPDTRVFRVTRPRSRDLATIIMLDTSASMAARLPDGQSVLDVQRLAVSLLGEALEQRGDAFKLCAFASNGREDVRMTDIKTFGERFDDAALSRLAGLRPRLSTQLGTALRHARAFCQARRPPTHDRPAAAAGRVVLCCAHRLPVAALAAASCVPALAHRIRLHAGFSQHRHMGNHAPSSRGDAARGDRARAQPHGRDHRYPEREDHGKRRPARP